MKDFALPELVALIDRPGRTLKPGGKGPKGTKKAGRRMGLGGGFGAGRNNSVTPNTVVAPDE